MNKLFVIVLLLAATACVSDLSYRYYGSTPVVSAKAQKAVEILYESPLAAYEAIADFQGRGSSDLIAQFQKEAAKISADAIIITTSSEDYDRSTQWAGSGINKDKHLDKFTNRRIFGTAIIYKNTERQK